MPKSTAGLETVISSDGVKLELTQIDLTRTRYLSQLGSLTRQEKRRLGKAVVSSTLTCLGVIVQ